MKRLLRLLVPDRSLVSSPIGPPPRGTVVQYVPMDPVVGSAEMPVDVAPRVIRRRIVRPRRRW